MLLQEPDGVLYGGVVGAFDLRGDLRVGDRPHVDTDFTGENVRSKPATVCAAAGDAWRSSSQLPGICWWPAMLCDEQLPRHLGPNPGPLGRRDRPVRRQPRLLVGTRRSASPPRPKPAWFGVEILNGTPSRVAARMLASVRSASQLLQPGRQWMHPRAEQSPHLLAGHRIAGVQAVDAPHHRSRPTPPGSRHVRCSRRPTRHDPSRWRPTPPPAASDSRTPTRQ